jgi:hypothetical protein
MYLHKLQFALRMLSFNIFENPAAENTTPTFWLKEPLVSLLRLEGGSGLDGDSLLIGTF